MQERWEVGLLEESRLFWLSFPKKQPVLFNSGMPFNLGFFLKAFILKINGLCVEKLFMCNVFMRRLIIFQWQVTDLKEQVVLEVQQSVVRQTDFLLFFSPFHAIMHVLCHIV